VGGAPFYAARALRALGADAVIVARCAEADRETLLPPLEAQGLPIFWRPARATSSFSFEYVGGSRRMVVEDPGSPWTLDDVLEWVRPALRGVDWLHVGGLTAADFPLPTLELLAAGRSVSFDGQGLVRAPRPGPLELERSFDPLLLEHISVLKLSESEARVIVDDLADLRELDVPELIVTQGHRGNLLIVDGLTEHVPAPTVTGVVDPTGAGDSFMAAYVEARSRGIEPTAAARDASDLVSALLRRANG
jgi:sugar/nucleoside kinase (ribokinase family)